MRRWYLFAAMLAVSATAPGWAAPLAGKPAASPRLTVYPASVKLSGVDAEQQLLASGAAKFSSLDPRIARVSPEGLVTALGSGTTRIRIRSGSAVTDVPVTVDARGGAPSFTRDVHPLLSKAGCNGGTCHGKAEGQHGFRLSLFGYDPQFDYDAIVRASGGRRVAKVDPARSLFLLKATSQIPHGGGARLRTDSHEYRLLTRWIASATPYQQPGEPALTGIQVYPPERSVALKGEPRLLVTANYADGSTRDVTRETKFTSNNPAILSVDEGGVAQSLAVPGAAAVMATYQGQVGVSRILVPRTGAAPTLPPATGTIDRLVWSRLSKLRIQPSEPAGDGEFLRRAHLDLIGTLPTPEEARTFLAECDMETGRGTHHGDTETRREHGEKGEVKDLSAAPRKQSPPLTKGGAGGVSSTPVIAVKARARLVERLLERPEYADLWALKWADLLRVNKEALGAKGAYAFYQWIREAVASNMPYDQFVREIVSASGSSAENGPVNLFRVLSKPEEAASSVSQVFLGVRIECAQCHHHPFEKWSQDDYFGMVGFFSGLKTKPDGPHSVLLTATGGGEVKNPRTGLTVPPHPLEGDPAEFVGEGDRRRLLAEWMASPENRFVPRMLVNRVWAHFLGRGLVDPVDDFRDTNPATNPELLDALAKEFVQGGFDVKRLIRTIMASQVYQLSSESNATNAADEQSFSRAYPKRLQAEVLLDAIASATGTAPELPGLPHGTRAIQVWDSEWSTQWQSYFLNVFGRPERTHPCECERSQEPSIVQVLHLMNAPEIQHQIADRRGRVRALAESKRSAKEVVDELFLAALARYPSPKEQAEAVAAIDRAGKDRSQATEDVLWALLNTVEFVFNH